MYPLDTFRRRIVFDDQGIPWPADSIELRRQLCCLDYPGQLIPDLIRNLGFIAVDYRPGCVELTLRSSTASRAAAVGFLYWLMSSGATRGCIRDLDQFAIELAPSPEALVSRIGEIGIPGSMLNRVAERPVGDLQLAAASPLRELLRRWTEAGGKLWFDDYATTIRQHLGDRFVLARVTEGGRIVIVAVGHGLRIPNRAWFTSVIGSDLAYQPDRAYGRWVNEAYTRVYRSQQPAISDCDVDIYWPGEGWVRRKYRRLIIPGTTADGEQYLLSTNCTEAQVSLRSLAA
jgi:hypothetical protein